MLSILLASTAFMLYQARHVEIAYTFSRLLPKTDTTQVQYLKFTEDFKQVGNTVVIAVENVDVFDPREYPHWKRFEENLDTISGVENILSPISAYTLTRNDSLKKLQPKAFSDISPDSLGELFHSLPFYQGLLYSRDGEDPLMLVQIEKDKLYNKNIIRIIESIKVVVADFEEQTGHVAHASGLPYLRMANTKKVSREIGGSIGLALVVTVFIMFLFLRSVKATLISMLVVLLGVCWTFGLIGSFGFTISILTAIIPSLIIVIGVPNCIFLINKYHAEYKYHKNQIRAVQRVIRKIGAATLLTNTTTALGFAAFILTDSDLLKEFGIIASINILVVFFISIIVIPSFYSLSRSPKRRHYMHLDKKWLKGFIGFLTHSVTHHRKMVYISLVVLTAVAAYGMTLMKATGNISEEYKKDDPLLLDLKYLEREFGGVVPLEIIIDTKKPRGVKQLSFIKKVNQLQGELEELPYLSKSLSIANGVKFAKQAYYRGAPEFYELPTRQEANFVMSYLPEQEEGLNLLNSMVDSAGRRARVSLQVEDLATEESRKLQAMIQEKVDSIFDPERYDVLITGASVVFLKGTSYLIKNLAISLLLAVSVIAIIMALLFRSLPMVVISLIPNLFPLLMTAGIMGYFGIPLKPSTILVFSIAFGISVDDTIHFLAKYRQELRANGWKIAEAVMVAIRETGVSMFYTSVVLFFGFSTFISSTFGGIVALGILVSITLVIAMLSNLLILPSLLMSLARKAASKDFNEPIISLYQVDDEDEDRKGRKRRKKNKKKKKKP